MSNTYNNRYARILLGRREQKDLNIEFNWSNLDPNKTILDKQTILVFGGNTANSSKDANGYAKSVESLLDNRFRKNTDILSFSYRTEPIKNGSGNSKFLEPEYAEEMHEIFNTLLKPLLYDNLGNMKEKQGIEKTFRKLIFVAHCGGSNFVDLIIDDFYATLLEKYQPATAELLLKKIQYFAYAPNEFPNHDVTSFYVNPYIDSNYSWARALSLIDNQGVDVDYPKGVSKKIFKASNRCQPGVVFQDIFQEYRASMFRSGQALYLIPDRMNPDFISGDHSIGCITKDKIVNSNTEFEQTAQLVNNAAKIVLNQFASEEQFNNRATFDHIAGLIYDNPPTCQRSFE